MRTVLAMLFGAALVAAAPCAHAFGGPGGGGPFMRGHGGPAVRAARRSACSSRR
jgi:hypothetical protein